MLREKRRCELVYQKPLGSQLGMNGMSCAGLINTRQSRKGGCSKVPETAVKPFDRATAEELRVSIRETVKNIVGNNITLDSISATYTPTDIKFTIKISQPDSSGMSTAERDFIHLAPLYGIAA